MPDTGFKVTGTVTSENWSTGVTTTRINTSDDSRAGALGTTFQFAYLQDFAFGIPAGATIDGIEVQVEMRTNNASYIATVQLSLSWNEVNYTATKSDTSTSTTDATKTFGGATDTWGRTWSDSEFADGTFTILLEGKSQNAAAQCQVDYVAIKVYYTESTGAQGARVIMF